VKEDKFQLLDRIEQNNENQWRENMEILVIGTEPPCIRCLTTYKRAKEIAQQFKEKVEVRKIAMNSQEAAKYGKIGSGGSLGAVTNVKPDFEKLTKVSAEISELFKDEAKNAGLIESKLNELDKVLQPVKEKSQKMGYLMTPVLVVNGQIKCMDHVPDKEAIQAWVELELRQ
jgi:hypothetical protein